MYRIEKSDGRFVLVHPRGAFDRDAIEAFFRSQDGASFSLRRFHDRLLSYGAIPVALIARLMVAEGTAR